MLWFKRVLPTTYIDSDQFITNPHPNPQPDESPVPNTCMALQLGRRRDGASDCPADYVTVCVVSDGKRTAHARLDLTTIYVGGSSKSVHVVISYNHSPVTGNIVDKAPCWRPQCSTADRRRLELMAVTMHAQCLTPSVIVVFRVFIIQLCLCWFCGWLSSSFHHFKTV
eukprot:scpid100856/ scgid0397/ 